MGATMVDADTGAATADTGAAMETGWTLTPATAGVAQMAIVTQ